MKVRDFAKLAHEMVIIVESREEKILIFNSEYWECIDSDVLDLEVDCIKLAIDEKGRARIIIKTATGVPVKVGTQDELQAALDSITVTDIKLTSDIKADYGCACLLRSGNLKTLNLNGHNITSSSDDDSSDAAIMVENGVLSIYGDSYDTIDGGSGSDGNTAVEAYGENAEVNIYGGRFKTGKNGKNEICPTIYATSGANVNIFGGEFWNDGSDEEDIVGSEARVLKIEDESGARIVCSGGTFRNQDPSEGDCEDTDTGATFLAVGCRVEKTGYGNVGYKCTVSHY